MESARALLEERVLDLLGGCSRTQLGGGRGHLLLDDLLRRLNRLIMKRKRRENSVTHHSFSREDSKISGLGSELA